MVLSLDLLAKCIPITVIDSIMGADHTAVTTGDTVIGDPISHGQKPPVLGWVPSIQNMFCLP